MAVGVGVRQARGIYMKIGRAESKDGRRWTRKPGIVLDRGERRRGRESVVVVVVVHSPLAVSG